MWAADAASAVLPTDAVTALDATFNSLGLITTDGQTESTDINSNGIPAFGVVGNVRMLITSEIITVKFVCLETNKLVQAIRTRQALSAVTVATGGKLSLTRGPGRNAAYALVEDAVDGSNHIRTVYPNCVLTALGDRQIAQGQPVQYDFTFTANLDAAGNSSYEYDVIAGLS
jgi:hypothetical protein